jgi:hypothetical protein
MQWTIDRMRREGVVIARTMEGDELPVLDVTHPRFAMPEDPKSYQALRLALLRSEQRHRLIPKFLMPMMVRSAAKRSRLMRAMFETNSSFLDGLSTYVMKLGAGNLLPPYDAPMDRQFASSPHVAFMRLRTQQVAGLLAEGLASGLTAADDRPLHLVNIAGGPAIDSLNALILVARTSPDLLRRPIVIHVLDLDEAGPFFGKNALTQMTATGGRLHGFGIAFERHAYDWNETAPLETLLKELIAQNAVIVASSEGGLFEYGSDAAIVANLKALHANGGGARLVVGSVTRADETRQRLIGASQFKLIPRGIDGFAPLATQAGFTIRKARETIWSDQVELRAE